VKLCDIGGVVRNLRLLTRVAIANYICMPIATVGLLLWFGSPPIIAAGFLIVAVRPGAAYGPPFTAMAKGNVAASTGLMVFLAGSSAICAPLLLRRLLPVMTRSQALNMDLLKIILTLLVTQLSPLFAGLCVRERRPALADKLKHPANCMSAALNLCIFGVIVIAHVRTLAAIRVQAFMGMFALLITSIAASWLLGEAGTANRKAMSFSTSVRNIAVSLVIATASFPGSPAVTAALVYGLFQTIM